MLESDHRVPLNDGPLPLARCILCLHYECYHDEQGCFSDPSGKWLRDPGILGRAALKATGSQCWCPKFTEDPDEAANLALEYGKTGALMICAVGALDRGDSRNVRRLIDQYIVRTPIDARDVDWLRAVERRLEALIPADRTRRDEFQDFTRMPAKLKEASIDPIEINPFPEGQVAHDVWAKATRKASEEVLRFRAEMLHAEPDRFDTLSHDNWFMTLIAGQFDIWAKRHVHIVWTEARFADFAVWLVNYAEAWLDSCQQMKFPPISLDSFLATLRQRLMARTEWWKAEARRYLNLQIEAQGSELSQPKCGPNSDIHHLDTDLHNPGESNRPRSSFLDYPRSEAKRMIALQLTKRPSATDAEICLALDDEGAELPGRWQRELRTRLFSEAYSEPKMRKRIETTISKVRRDMRARGLLHGK